MRRWLILLAAALVLLTMHAKCAQLPSEVERALPEESEELLEDVELSEGAGALGEGLAGIWEMITEQAGDVVRQRLRGAAAVVLTAVLCGAVDGFYRAGGGSSLPFLPMVGAVSVTAVTTGSLGDLIGLGAETIRSLGDFSTVLLPAMAAATAATGAVSSATAQQVSAVILVDLLLRLINHVLIPAVYLYTALLTAAACLPGNRLEVLAGGLKKVIAWLLTTPLLAFTLYLSAVRVVSGAADSLSVKVAKTAISGVVPVVGGIIAEASETVLAGAGMLRGVIGVGGMLAILAACAYPFLQLGIQYLLYKLAGFLSAMVGPPELCRLIDGLGGAFGLVLGMTGACALLLLVSLLSFAGAVVP